MNKKIIATCQLNNFGGIVIVDIIRGIEDKIKFAYHDGEKFGRTSTAKIRYNEEGEPFFISGKQKYFLSESLCFVVWYQKEYS